MNKLLSIIVPIHSIPAGEGLSPLARWSRKISERCELILSLDVDREEEFLEEWCETNISATKKIVKGFNNNPGDTRNMGMQLATGEWIAFVDSDDFFHPHRALIAIEDLGSISDLIVCRYQNLDHEEILINECKMATSLSELTVNLGFWRCLYRRTLANSVVFPSIRMAEDQVYFSRFISLNPKISFSNEKIYGYIIGGSQQLTRLSDAKTDLKNAISILHNEVSQSKIHVWFRKQILLRQYISLLKGARMSDKINYSLRFLSYAIRPSYFSRLIVLVILLIRNQIATVRVGKS